MPNEAAFEFECENGLTWAGAQHWNSYRKTVGAGRKITAFLYSFPPFQILSAFAVSFGPFAVGLSKGYTSPALASMQEPPPLPVDNATAAAAAVSASMTSLSITEQQGSWIASLSLLGALFGGLCAGVVIRYGRRRTLWLVTAPFSASWFLTMFATCVEMIYVTAFLVGFFSAIIQLATQVGFVGDIFISY